MKEKTSPTQRALNLWALILIFWSFYRAYFRTDLPIWVDEFLVKPIVFILPVFFFIRRVEKKPFFASLDLHGKNLLRDLVLGIGIGLLFFFSGQAGTILRQGLKAFSGAFHLGAAQIVFLTLISLATAISEEILSRGFILKRLYADSKNIWQAVFLSSILFFFLHVPMLFTNDKLSGFMLLRLMTTDLILSFVVSILYFERKTLLVPIIIHAIYNLSFALLF